MFEVGFTEIVLILGIALLVLGPERLPKLAADLGRWAGKARAMARQLKNQLEQEAGTFDDLRNPLADNPRKSQTIHTPPPAAAAEPAPGAAATPSPAEPSPAPAAAPVATADSPTHTPDVTDESKPA